MTDTGPDLARRVAEQQARERTALARITAAAARVAELDDARKKLRAEIVSAVLVDHVRLYKAAGAAGISRQYASDLIKKAGGGAEPATGTDAEADAA